MIGCKSAADLRCWPVSHAQGEYVPKTLSTISQMAPRPDFAPVAAGIGEMHNYATHFPGKAAVDFVHPGIAESAEDIARARKMIAEKREPWYGCFKALESCWSADPNQRVPQYPTVLESVRCNRILAGLAWGAAPNWYYEWAGWGTLMKRDASFDSAERLAFGATSR